MTDAAFETGTAVAIEGRGLLILGPSGAGKSALALDLLALGGALIADDVVIVARRGDDLLLSCPPGGEGLVEARGIGLLRAPPAGPAPLALVLDLGAEETARLPEPRTWSLSGVSVPLARKPSPLQPAAIRAAVLSGGPIDPHTSISRGSLARSAARDQGSSARDSRMSG
ncbi:MAG: serine kinase [Pseudomonadota bacterium]